MPNTTLDPHGIFEHSPNMTAPPTQMPLFTEHLHAAASCFSPPASSTTDLALPWAQMPPFQDFSHNNAPRPQRKSMSPTNEGKANNGLLFITGNKPADFKSKKNMTKVRKKAMGSYLEKERKPRVSLERSRLQSEQSTGSGSRASVGSQEATDIMNNDEALKISRGESRRPGRRPSSPIKSPVTSSYDQQISSPEMQISRIRRSVDFLLDSAPIVLPMRTGISLPYDETPTPLLESIGKSLDPFRAMFQANHPQVSVEELKFHCSRSFGTRAMGQHWIPTLVKSPHAFLSTLCIASAHYDAIQERQVESVQTLALRQEVIHLIGQQLLNPTSRTHDFNIIALTQLIASEIISREETALNYHESGVEAMIKQRGGVNQLGVNGRLASTISWVSLESAILRESKPQSIFSDFCASATSKNYPSTGTIPESPLFCPRGELETIRRSPRCSSKTLDLLKDIRMMMDLFLHETKQSRQNVPSLKNIYKKITLYPSASELQKTNVLTSNDWKYEAIRITSIITATAIIKRIPLSEALNHATQSENLTSIYTFSSASRSNESLISPTNLRHDSPVTCFSTSPSYATSPAFSQSNLFTFIPSRPSIASTSSLDIPLFPAAQAPAPSGPDALLKNIKMAINNSDLSEGWADMAGVLLWVALTIGAASRKSDKVLKKWFSALAIRVSIMLCFEHPEPIHATLLRMAEVIEGVSQASSNSEIIGRESEGKRRRV